MTSDAIALVSLCVAMLGTLVGFVWKAAVTATEHHLRLTTLEEERITMRSVLADLNRSVVKLDKHLAVSDARASQGQFADSDIPPR